MGAKWWETVEEPTTVWRACVTDDGLDYYFNSETNETTWDKPEELMTSDELNSTGEWYWVPHETEAFAPAKKLGGAGKKVEVEFEDGTRAKVPESECRPFNRSSLKRVVADLTLLDDMAAQLILHNLKARFKKEEIYTNIGTILISVNPYQRLPLYTKEVVRKYVTKPMGKEMPPHVFNIAHDSFYGVTNFEQLQSIVISGESGAGKTEATKQCLQYLAAIAGSINNVENKILMANPILEGFGNAKTLRNDNSSRFGKYIEVYFNAGGRICGSNTQNYLLEKIRVVQPAKGERNFHIFYNLIKGAGSDLKKKLHIDGTSAGEYPYLASCTEVPSINDTEDFNAVENAFKDLAFSETEKLGLFSIVAGVALLGNLKFRETKPDESEVDPSTQKWLEAAAANFGVDVNKLGTALVQREIRVRGQEKTMARQDTKQASDCRNALAKFVYSKMFDWLVVRVNKSMGETQYKNSGQLYIGILDIFGFEIFKHNSFEQLCINFTNEMLQQHFNNNTFKLEEAVYKSEGIDFHHIDFIDNEPMIDLITGSRIGILPILDEELIVPGGSDAGFLEKLMEHQASNRVLVPNSRDPTSFGVRHYAGAVQYDGKGFLEKNRDTLYLDLVEMMQSSNSEFVNQLYPPDEEVQAKDRKSSLSKQFQKQLADLMKALYQTEPHYIRCIKPNEEKAPLKFVAKNCYEQLTYSGVFEAVAIRKKGFPFRLSHKEFASRYGKLCNEEEGAAKDIAAKVIKKMKLDKENVRIGKTRILYRAMEYRKLELEWEIVTKNERIIQNLDRLTKVDYSDFSEKEKELFIIELADAVREADLFKIKTKSAEKGRNLLEQFVEERMDTATKKKLEKAKKNMDRELLIEVLEHCDKQGYITKLVRACKELLEQIDDAEAALEVAVKDMNEEFLQRALSMCDDINYNGESVKKARKLLKDVKKAKSGCQKALEPPYKLDWLQKAVDFCIQISFTSFQAFVDCNALRFKIAEANKLLKAAKKAMDEDQLEKALNFCYDKNNFKGSKYRCDLEAECRELLKEVKWVNKETAKGIRECEEHQVRAVVAKADSMGMSNPDIKALTKLVKGDYNKFLAEQFKKAKKCKHHSRAIRVSLKQKDREFSKSSTVLYANSYAGLKNPMSWTKEKWTWGSDKTRAANMMKFQVEHLHSPLTTAFAQGGGDPLHMKIINEKAIHAFDTVQKAMGQRNTRNMDLRLAEMLTNALNVTDLRDEIYLYIIKQCSDNKLEMQLQSMGRGGSDGSPVAKAFELLALCLCVFPPSVSFEAYLEHFIRSPEHSTLSAKYNLQGLLRRRMYHGPVSTNELPKQSEFAMGCTYQDKVYNAGAIFPVLSSRLKLNEFQDDHGGKKSKKTSGTSEKKEKKTEKEKKSKSKKSKAKASAWQTATDPTSGKTYYFNPETGATQWEPPESEA
eukprot:m.144552 g.144552  ORF g.144552 m.144552 type:complete len:1420 (-) comp14925_c0_seq1:86-4345(-)